MKAGLVHRCVHRCVHMVTQYRHSRAAHRGPDLTRCSPPPTSGTPPQLQRSGQTLIMDWGGADGYWRARCSALGGFVRPWRAATPFPEARHKSMRQVLRSSHFIDKSMETPRFTSFVHPCEAELEMEARLAGCRRCTGSRLVGRRACLVRRIVGGGCSRYSVIPPLWGAHTLKKRKSLNISANRSIIMTPP